MKKENLHAFVNEARIYLREKYHIDIVDLYSQFNSYEAFLYEDSFPHFINFLYKKGFSKAIGLYIKDIAKEFYQLDLDYFLMISYLSGKKSVPSLYYSRYRWSREIHTPFRYRRKYNKNHCKNKKKSQEQRDKEQYCREKFKNRTKGRYRYSYWGEYKGFVSKKERRNSKRLLQNYKKLY